MLSSKDLLDEIFEPKLRTLSMELYKLGRDELLRYICVSLSSFVCKELALESECSILACVLRKSSLFFLHVRCSYCNFSDSLASFTAPKYPLINPNPSRTNFFKPPIFC